MLVDIAICTSTGVQAAARSPEQQQSATCAGHRCPVRISRKVFRESKPSVGDIPDRPRAPTTALLLTPEEWLDSFPKLPNFETRIAHYKKRAFHALFWGLHPQFLSLIEVQDGPFLAWDTLGKDCACVHAQSEHLPFMVLT